MWPSKFFRASDYCSGSVEDLTRYSNISDKGFLTPNSCTRFLLSGDNPLMNFIFMTISSKSLQIQIAYNFIILMYSLTELSNCNGNATLSTGLSPCVGAGTLSFLGSNMGELGGDDLSVALGNL